MFDIKIHVSLVRLNWVILFEQIFINIKNEKKEMFLSFVNNCYFITNNITD